MVQGKGKIVCFPIFYDSNWVITINGKETPTIRVNNGLIGVITTEDENNYCLRYKYSNTMLTCIIISVICFCLTVYIYKKQKKEYNSNNKASNV